jgi:hypothetical protein
MASLMPQGACNGKLRWLCKLGGWQQRDDAILEDRVNWNLTPKWTFPSIRFAIHQGPLSCIDRSTPASIRIVLNEPSGRTLEKNSQLLIILWLILASQFTDVRAGVSFVYFDDH